MPVGAVSGVGWRSLPADRPLFSTPPCCDRRAHRKPWSRTLWVTLSLAAVGSPSLPRPSPPYLSACSPLPPHPFLSLSLSLLIVSLPLVQGGHRPVGVHGGRPAPTVRARSPLYSHTLLPPPPDVADSTRAPHRDVRLRITICCTAVGGGGGGLTRTSAVTVGGGRATGGGGAVAAVLGASVRRCCVQATERGALHCCWCQGTLTDAFVALQMECMP